MADKYAITFKNKHGTRSWLYTMKTKIEALKEFKRIRKPNVVKALRSRGYSYPKLIKIQERK